MIEFPDISHYQANLSLTGAVAAIAKATQGVSYADPSYVNFHRQATALRIPFSGYHWIDRSDPGSQARWYRDHAGGAPCMWDAEDDGSTVPRIVAATVALRALGGHAWGAYLPHWWWQGHLGSPNLRPLQAAGLVLVSSDYRTTPPNTGWQPYGGVTPTVWQFTDAQMFNGFKCDFNKFNGTPAQLGALFTGATPPPSHPLTQEGETMYAFKEPDTSGVWISNGIRRRPAEWSSFTAMCSAGLVTAPAPGSHVDGIGASAYVLVIPKGQCDWYGGPADTTGTGDGLTEAGIATAVVNEMHDRLAP